MCNKQLLRDVDKQGGHIKLEAQKSFDIPELQTKIMTSGSISDDCWCQCSITFFFQHTRQVEFTSVILYN